MIGMIIELIKSGIGLFQKKQSSDASIAETKTEQVNETNREEIRKGGLSYRTVLGYVCAVIILYSYVIVPVLDYFGIVVFQMPIGEIFKVIALLLSGGF
ncbi:MULTISPECIES: hypothetical protein [Serratia]|uniref:hypothetical protein n=1 Tax=Serratia TaxID=613 RepID=UPI0008A293FD|nr:MULTISPECIES: hypothetical protein [Serratia]EGT3596270.1 hypothetical protein [Serratia marcescens]OFS96496.1 hypothetical protein HMPREF3138_03550 [Serratia sp. HMSC15F11]TWY25493.1 hypothetical protein FR965_26405 [Serratia marcescens]WLS21467.1 hypothetical protein RAA91_10010 [Serratia marcescens]HCB1448142.1 hypothetical protein [Serratia marcescens]